MASKTANRVKRNEKKKGTLDFGGLDPEMMMSLRRKIPPNAVTGRLELLDILKYMEENHSEIELFATEVDRLGVGAPKINLDTYDYNALSPTIKPEAEWVIQLQPTGFEDKSGNPVDPDGAHSSTGIQPTFILYCYDDTGAYRLTHDCIGLLDSKTIIQIIQRAIAEPYLPFKPGLPSRLVVSIKFTPHIAAIKPFLDSLPAPFSWRLETRQEAEGVHEGVHALNQRNVEASLVLAEKAKTAGNKAFAQKDRQSAIKAYSEALSQLVDVFAQKPNDEDKKKAVNLRAICFANRAATYLVPGDGMDLKKALEDGQAAEIVSPSYAKAYIRQSTVFQRLGKMDYAQDAIARALRRKDLENDSGLVDCLVDLLTGGQGFAQDEGTFKNWMLDVLINDRKSAERLKGIGGEWRRRCDAEFSKYKR